MSAFEQETVTSVRHWTDTMFSFTTSRQPSFRFRNGQFAMIGLEVDGRPLTRAYSLAGADYEESLEFLSIKVQDGPLTSRLQHIKPGDRILVGRKATGTLVLDSLTPGRRLLLLATGTGLAPFLAIIKDPETYARFDRVILAHGCRRVAELAYGEMIRDELPEHPLVGDDVKAKLVYYPTVTREPYLHRGRVTELVASGQLFADTGEPPLSAEHDRIMLCGSPAMVADARTLFTARGLTEGSNAEPGSFVVERAFVER